jgi:hypothetical protein
MWYVQLLCSDLAYASCIVGGKSSELARARPDSRWIGPEGDVTRVYGVGDDYSHGIRIDFGLIGVCRWREWR